MKGWREGHAVETLCEPATVRPSEETGGNVECPRSRYLDGCVVGIAVCAVEEGIFLIPMARVSSSSFYPSQVRQHVRQRYQY